MRAQYLAPFLCWKHLPRLAAPLHSKISHRSKKADTFQVHFTLKGEGLGPNKIVMDEKLTWISYMAYHVSGAVFGRKLRTLTVTWPCSWMDFYMTDHVSGAAFGRKSGALTITWPCSCMDFYMEDHVSGAGLKRESSFLIFFELIRISCLLWSEILILIECACRSTQLCSLLNL